jgi:4-cresol dehydrogenase (hydroxylating)
VLFTLEIAPGGLGAAIDALRELKRRDIVPGIVHVANRRRRDISLSPMAFDYYRSVGRAQTREQISGVLAAAVRGEWAALGHVAGDRGRCGAATRQIGRILGTTGTVRFMTRRKLRVLTAVARRLRLHDRVAMLTGLATLFEVMHGRPTDESLKSIYWPRSTVSTDFRDPDRGKSGLLYCVPLIPMVGPAAVEAADIAERVTQQFGFSAAVTLNTIHATCLEGVVSFDFDKADAAECDRAAECLRALSAEYRIRGLYPLRLDIDGMRSAFDESDVFWQTAQAVKRALDPRGIIAPSRYQLGEIPAPSHRTGASQVGHG